MNYNELLPYAEQYGRLNLESDNKEEKQIIMDSIKGELKAKYNHANDALIDQWAIEHYNRVTRIANKLYGTPKEHLTTTAITPEVRQHRAEEVMKRRILTHEEIEEELNKKRAT